MKIVHHEQESDVYCGSWNRNATEIIITKTTDEMWAVTK